MSDQINVKGLPPHLHEWIQRERSHRGASIKSIVIESLEMARENCESGGATVVPEAQSPHQTLPFKFVDLFAGIGGMRFGLEKTGGDCVFTCERDKHCRKTYSKWFGDADIHGDIQDLDATSIPNHDLLAAGFPCQPFSLAGVSKKNSLGRKHGFLDETQGTLFYDLASIIKVKRPPVILLENVKNLCSHDKGKTWSTINSTLTALGYEIFAKVIDAADYVPQHRERVFIVGFRRDVFGKAPPFEFPDKPTGAAPKLKDILLAEVPDKFTLTPNLWKYLQDYAEKHRRKGNGFGFGIADPEGITRTLSARYYKDGSEILLKQDCSRPRRLTPDECRKLMGFPELQFPVSDMQAYKQCGNAVVPLVVEDVARRIVETMRWKLTNGGKGCLF